MASSMTGFGRGVVSLDGRRIQVEIKSVNNRYCELFVRMPRELLALEPELRRQITDSVQRGKLEVYVTYSDLQDTSMQLQMHTALAQQYCEALEELGACLERPYIASVQDLLRIPGWLQAESGNVDLEGIRPLLEEAIELALTQLSAAKQVEGERLLSDLLSRWERLEEGRIQLLERAPEVAREYRKRFEMRLQEWMQGVDVDPTRVLTEVAIFTDKSDIAEELTRLQSHLCLLKETLMLEGAIGKKLDFVVQEVNREINTVGSKANDITLTQIVVELKAELERFREQIQNLE